MSLSALIAHLFEDLTALERFQASEAKRREAEATRAGGGRDSGDFVTEAASPWIGAARVPNTRKADHIRTETNPVPESLENYPSADTTL